MMFFIQVYLANLRLKEVGTDVLIAAYEPILIKYVLEKTAIGMIILLIFSLRRCSSKH